MALLAKQAGDTAYLSLLCQYQEQHDRDMTERYENNTNRGKAKVTIKGVGDYGGTRTVKFTIKSKLLEWWENVLELLLG